MPLTVPQNSGTQDIPGFFDKTTTDGDASRFIGASRGYRKILTVTAAQAAGEAIPVGTQYLVGALQLGVSLRIVISGTSLWSPIMDGPTYLASPEILGDRYFEETDSSGITLKNGQVGDQLLLSIPHTSVPAQLRDKVQVLDQGANAAVELLGNGDGLLLRSGSGRRYLVRVDNAGHLGAEPR